MRVYGVDYRFLACGDVFTQGLFHAAGELGLDYAHAAWDAPDLAARVAAFAPDLLFVVHGRKFSSRFPKSLGCRSAVWLLDEPYEVDDTARFSPRFDHVFVNDAATLDRHRHPSYLPVCYDPVVHWPSGEVQPFALGFIGGGNATRDRYLSVLAHHGLLTYVIGGPWTSRDVQARVKSGNIPAAQTARWYQQTKIVLNVFRERHHYNAKKTPATSLNPRVYEALACGALVVSEWRPEVETVVPELPTFRTPDECVAIVRELLADPMRAETIRQRCLDRIAPHTYQARLETVLATMGLQVAA